ncbi:MAG: hypothetical protein EOP67_51555 [Sphingomonas sp.]|nr:MAG: hypothetical protein EOP67_51555 [Sphingomonas sp.]
MTVKLVFANGQTQEVNLRAGTVFIDYVSREDVPGSKRVEGLVSNGKQIRTFTIPVPNKGVLEKVVLESPGRGPAATTAAITAELLAN